MKVGYVSTLHGYPWGGSEELWFQSASEALDQGHSVILSLHQDAWQAAKVDELVKRGARRYCHRLSRRTFLERVRTSARFRILRRQPHFPVTSESPFRQFFLERPDAVCVSQGDAYSFLLLPDLRAFLTLTRVPYVVVSQGAFPYQILTYGERLAMREFFRGAYRAAFVADWSRRLVERQIAGRIDNGVLLDNPPNLVGTGILPFPHSDTVKLAFVGRLEVFHKAIDVLFEALASEEWRARNWRLTLYGKGADEDYLRELALHLALGEKVCFAGHVDDVRDVWRANELGVLTSYSEGQPLAIVEGMLCGRAALVTSVGGMPELVQDGVSGFVSDYPSAQSIRVSLNRMWERRADLKQMGVAAYAAARDRFAESPGRRLLHWLCQSAASVPTNGPRVP